MKDITAFITPQIISETISGRLPRGVQEAGVCVCTEKPRGPLIISTETLVFFVRVIKVNFHRSQ